MASATYKVEYKLQQIRLKDTGYKVPERTGDFRPEDLDRSFYPTDERLSFLASITYRTTYEGLPEDWVLLTRGKNNKDGYFGAAFFHEGSRQLVISHRGTNDFKDFKADFKGIAENNYTSQIHSACTFVFLVLNLVHTNDISISITGHSLGAWLAQITGFAIEYLTVEGDRLRDLDKSERRFHPHIVTFDSPGCYEMLCKMSNDYFPDYDKEDFIQALDVTNYFIAPNKVNACNHHVGKKLCFQFESSEFEGNSWLRSLLRPRATHTWDFHNSDNFFQALRNSNKILKVVKWPTRDMKNVLKDFLTNTLAYIGLKPSETDEYTECRKYINQANDFRPDPDRLKKDNVDIAYQTGDYDDTIDSISLFKKEEIDFLIGWEKLRKNQIRPGKIIQFLDENHLESFYDFLPDFEIFNREIKCENVEKLKKLMNRIKWIFVFFPDVKEVMRSQILITSSVFEPVSG